MISKIQKDKRAAMEMSVGTIVTIVLLMSVLILGIFLVQKIFGSSTNAIDAIDNEVQNEIQKLFGEEGQSVAIYPTSRRLTLEQGDRDKGLAFAIKNLANEPQTFSYSIEATSTSNCPGISEEKATGYLIGGSGSTGLLPSGGEFGPELVTLIIPETAPLCTMEYRLIVTRDSDSTIYKNMNFYVIIE